MTYEEFKEDIFKNIKNLPNSWRKGQKVFNYIESKYGIARVIQFEHKIDCFYKDDLIESFLEKAYKLL